jgi:hypothetical protein
MAGKNLVPIRDNNLRHAMQFVHMLHICFSHLQGRKGVLHFDEVSIFGEPVNYYKDAVEQVGRWYYLQ